jgi:hypothetical protein
VLLAAILQDCRHMRFWRLAPHGRRPQAVRRELRTIARHLRHGQWRQARMYCNGYLAEPAPCPDQLARCGSGWTKRRAMASLYRHASRCDITIGDNTNG